MSKNSQNNYYYEVGVFNGSDLIYEYVTTLPIVRQNGLVHDKLMNLIKKEHGDGVLVLFNKKEGNLPNDNRPIIDINLPPEPTLNYNK